ncbi:MAG TPA: GNAT family N-acetyltransferase [Acidimicrobiales bacterium]|nr:GNAT family N-acetyltransferase [Acidimicrobiales bacterium]
MPQPEITVEVLRDPTAEDATALASILPHLSSARPPDPAELRDLASSGTATIFVARADGRIVGTLSLARFAVPTGRRAWIEDVVVDPAHRGQGVASQLIGAALRLAAETGCRTVDLTSRPSRSEANRLYERLGFARRETNVYRFNLES